MGDHPAPATWEDARRLVSDSLLYGEAFMTSDGKHVPHGEVVVDPDGGFATDRVGRLYRMTPINLLDEGLG